MNFVLRKINKKNYENENKETNNNLQKKKEIITKIIIKITLNQKQGEETKAKKKLLISHENAL